MKDIRLTKFEHVRHVPMRFLVIPIAPKSF